MGIWTGTSGYNYPEWKGRFYPERLSAAKMLGFYAERFRTVEINYTFYRMPSEKTVAGWVAETPDGFRLTLKAPKRITHERRLKDAADSLRRFCELAALLGTRLGVLLFQLPPNLKCDVGLLEAFLAELPPGAQAAFEFRHASWLCDAVYECLAARRIALCIADTREATTPFVPTADYGYLRLRDEGYEDADLVRWAERVAEMRSRWRDTFVYFKHEDEGKGPEFAQRFMRAVETGSDVTPR
jgi:uncharacterized protein YecE (DUF72 family)